MYVSISKGAKLTGVARSTIYKDIEDGKLSIEHNARGKKEIHIAELERVYGKVDISTDTEDDLSSDVSSVVERSSAGMTKSGDQLAVLQERLEAQKSLANNYEKTIEMIREERERERRQFQSQLESLEKALEKSQDGQNKLTLLLEHKESEGAGDWKKAMKAVEARVANQEKENKEERERAQKILRQNQQLKKALEAEKNKSLWQKLFG